MREAFMRQALSEARIALEAGEVPVGAVIVCEGRIIAVAHNEIQQRTQRCSHCRQQLGLWAGAGFMGVRCM